MEPTTEFAHGNYGDLSGVTLYGPPEDGWFWNDRLAISDSFFGPIAAGILDRFWTSDSREFPPKLATEWNEIKGWADSSETTAVSAADGTEFANALAALKSSDVEPHCSGCTADDCLRCAIVMHDFITSRLSAGGLFIERD